MHCAHCGRPASPGDGALCRYCGGPLAADDPMMAYGAANPHQPQPKKARGGGVLRILGGSGGAGIIALVLIARLSMYHAPSGATSTVDPSAHAFNDPLTSNTFGWNADSHAYFKSDGYHITQSYIEYAPV